jgi:hypothetical protein
LPKLVKNARTTTSLSVIAGILKQIFICPKSLKKIPDQATESTEQIAKQRKSKNRKCFCSRKNP